MHRDLGDYPTQLVTLTGLLHAGAGEHPRGVRSGSSAFLVDRTSPVTPPTPARALLSRAPAAFSPGQKDLPT